MAWIELHQSLPGHRKTMRLRRALKICQAQAVGHLCMLLWLWCLDNCPDGDLSSLMDCEIAEAAGYVGKDPATFVAALRESGYIDADMRIHDWQEYVHRGDDIARERARRMRTAPRMFVFRRDGYRCVYCGSNNDLTLDHLTPFSRGGDESPENLVTCCRSCNSRKGARTPQEAGFMEATGDAHA